MLRQVCHQYESRLRPSRIEVGLPVYCRAPLEGMYRFLWVGSEYKIRILSASLVEYDLVNYMLDSQDVLKCIL